jgi:peptidoglycan/LPS O-acetylase OafA/YrhL
VQDTDVVLATTLDLRSKYQLPRSIPQLDRLRGLAILLVLLNHSDHIAPRILDGFFAQGWIGVDIFFVISGFLITGILWDSRGNERYFRRFYARRILRIWPVYLLILFLAFCIIPLWRWSSGGLALNIPKEPIGIWAYLLFIQNLFGGLLFLSPLLGVTWSLAIEEQFYLVWPVVMRFASRRVALPCLLAGFLAAPFIRIWAIHRGISQVAIYYHPLTHYDGLICGAFVALWLRSAMPMRKTLLLAGIALLLSGLTLDVAIQPLSVLEFTAVALFSTGLLLVALVSENAGRLLHRIFFMNKTLAFFGFISYGLYLYHFSILRFAMSDRLAAKFDRWHHPSLTGGIMAVCGFGLSILIAWISRVTLERAALSKKGIFG